LSKAYLAHQVLVSPGLTLICDLPVRDHSKLQGTNQAFEDAVELARAIGKWVCNGLTCLGYTIIVPKPLGILPR
jgi:hypothetical protein